MFSYNVIAKKDFMREKHAIYKTLAVERRRTTTLQDVGHAAGARAQATAAGAIAADNNSSNNSDNDDDDDPVSPDVLAVFFAVLAFGSQANLELPPNHPSGETYITLAQQALTVSRFLTRNTIRAVQCLASRSL